VALPLHTHAKLRGLDNGGIYKILGLREALAGRHSPKSVLVRPRGEEELAAVDVLLQNNFAGVDLSSHPQPTASWPGVFEAAKAAVIAEGDVIQVRPSNGLVSVLYRRAANSNWLFVTERCNSLCLMCSQPPRDEDDSWRIDEALRLIPLLDKELDFLGITGGEPTLLGDDLFRILATCEVHLPKTRLHVLTNGRRFVDLSFAKQAIEFRDRVTWAVPIYSDISEFHDHIVQAPGAFHETIHGLLNLAEYRSSLEIRVVLHKLSIGRLRELAEYVVRNLPFSQHVAMMGLEPIGLAKRNMDALWIDPVDYAGELEATTLFLSDAGMKVSIYNLPLCVIPSSVRPFARQSISEWKNVFPPTCDPCTSKGSCAGFFSSAGVVWLSRGIAPMGERAS